MAQSTPSEDRSGRGEEDFASQLSPVGFGSDSDPTRPNARPSFLVDLAATIENVVIPRLQVNHEHGRERSAANTTSSPIGPNMVQIFVDRLMRGESHDAMRHVEALLERGMAMDVILLDLLGPAARIMGEMWVEDNCNFVDVTLGMTRIQHIIRQLRLSGGSLGVLTKSKGRALLVPAPGEQHIFGLRVVEEFLLRDGWDIDCRLQATPNDILFMVRDEAYDFIGFSLSGERLLEPLASAIRLTRLNSRNRAIRIMVGGVFFVDQPDGGREIDADAVMHDARAAVAKANEWHDALRLAQ